MNFREMQVNTWDTPFKINILNQYIVIVNGACLGEHLVPMASNCSQTLISMQLLQHLYFCTCFYHHASLFTPISFCKTANNPQ